VGRNSFVPALESVTWHVCLITPGHSFKLIALKASATRLGLLARYAQVRMLAPVLSAGDGALAVAFCQQPGGPLASTSRSTRAGLHTRDRGRCRVDGEASRARDTLGVQLALAGRLEEVLLRALSMCAGSGRWPGVLFYDLTSLRWRAPLLDRRCSCL